jgi:hypothetical protein
VDSAYTTVEGAHDTGSRLLVYPDLPVTIEIWKDNVELSGSETGGEILGTWNPAPLYPDGDELLSSEVVYPMGAGAIHGIIVDTSPSSEFEMLRREPGGGFRAFQNFTLLPIRRWLETQSDMFTFADLAPSTYSPPSYVGRGLLQGEVRQTSPTTNEAKLTALGVADIRVTVPPITEDVNSRVRARSPSDSLFTLTWDPVPGAAGYWIDVYSFQPSVTESDRRLAGSPAPLMTWPTHDYLVALVGASTTTYKIGSATGITFRFDLSGFRYGSTYLARIAAVDADGRLIAMTMGGASGDAMVTATTGQAGHLTVSARGAIAVTPAR